ncbi:MAG: TIR domain-containing protein [Candidatus Eremiobacteraeota bacterium]|nr:TIR domain-containing protein [Candidatus Eremiobacteraeota bacterium]
MPRWVVSAGLLAGIYAAAMIGAALWLPHEWDWQVLKWLGAHVAPTFSPEVSIVDVDWNLSDFASNRRRVANFLDGLVKSNQRPSAVILDIQFDPCQSNPCTGPLASADEILAASIRNAARRFPVYATEEPQLSRDDVIIGPLNPQDARIYSVLSGAAQTHFTIIPNSEGLFYRICYAGVPVDNSAGEPEGSANVWAMVARVLMTPRVFAESPPCDSTHIPVRMGPKIPIATPVVYKFANAHEFANYGSFDDKMYVIVGTIKADRPPFTDRSGPELLGWALSNALDQGSLVGRTTYYDVQPQNAMLLLVVPVFSGLAVLAYAAAFFQLKRLRLRGWRHRICWLSAGAAAVIGLAIVAMFETWLLASHHLQPQVSLIVLGVVLAAGLSGVRGSQVLYEESHAISAAPEETYDYDVFISYAHEERAWVFEHVFAPFRDARLPDGRKLTVFFDTSSIRAGAGWQTTLSLAIDASRFIVPVYSESYFRQPYCRFEISRAHRKWVLAGEESRCVLPVVRGHPAIWAAVDDIQALSVDDHPDLVLRYVAEVVDRLSRNTGTDPPDAEAGAS